MEARIELAAVPASAPAARRFARQILADWGLSGMADDVLLLTSELVTNALLHAGTPMTLTLCRSEAGVRVEVRDGSPTLPVPRHYSHESATGRGLRFVDQISRAWGVDELSDDAARKRVWADVAVTAGVPQGATQETSDDVALAGFGGVDWLREAESL